jgi:hypothetical protein
VIHWTGTREESTVKVTDDVKNVRRVHVELSAGEVRRLIYDKVADTLNADVDAVVEHLRVDLSDGASATTYVRGELPVSRDQLLESLGLTPTEPVETDGAAVAESLGDHVTDTSDVVETPEVQVDRPEGPATITVQSVLDDLRSLNLLLGQAYEADMPSVPLEQAISHLALLFSVIQKYRDCVLVEGGDSQRVVPRPVSEDSLQSARLKLAELINSPRRPEGRATATDLHYVLALLGGVL